MSSDLPLEIASTLQTASLRRNPDPRHDINPSTAASKREPVTVSPFTSTPQAKPKTKSSSSRSQQPPPPSSQPLFIPYNHHDEKTREVPAENIDDDIDVDDDIDREDGTRRRPAIPRSAIEPVPRQSPMRVIPDLRFEQNYLKSLEGVRSWWGVAWVTLRDQFMLPMLQGAIWSLALAGWKHWNRAARFQGKSVGARIRRWWWSVNEWRIPDAKKEL